MARHHDEEARDVGLLVRQALLRTDRTVLRPVWRAAHELFIRTLAVYLRRCFPGATVYARGSFASGEPIYGVSDIDLAVVVAEGERPPLEKRWQELRRRFPRFGRLLRHFAAYEDRELATAVAGNVLTSEDAVILGARAPWDAAGLLVRPGLAGPARTWRRVAGRERRPVPPRWDREDERVAAWLELQHWWQYAFAESLRRSPLEHPSLCVRLVAEPARIWLALAHGEHPRTRREVLERTRARLPDEEETLSATLELLRRLPRRPAADLGSFLPFLVRQSSRIAQVVERHAGEGIAVELAGVYGAEPPLVDFRALVAPRSAEETLVPLDGDPARPDVLRRAVAAESDGRRPVLRRDDLLVLPTFEPWPRGILRSVQCRMTDPVSFAVLGGSDTAVFADTRAWSARSWARRAVAEHAAWLALEGEPPRVIWAGRPQPSARVAGVQGAGRLLTAARAALFRQSLEAGRPLLPLTLDEVASTLGAPGAEALAAYRAGAVDQRTFDALASVVRRLPAYS